MDKVLLFLMILMLVLANGGLIFMHEQAHQAIYRGYGIESEINYFAPGATATTTSNETYKAEDWRFLRGLHALNETFSYQFLVLVNAFFAFTFFGVLLSRSK